MLSENITKWIVMQAELSEGNEVIIRYGLKRIKMLITDMIFTMVMGILLGVFIESILFHVSFVLLRLVAGGYHSPTEKKCKIDSAIITFLSIIVLKYIYFNNIIMSCSFHLFINFIIIRESPIESGNKPLSPNERRVNHNKVIVILIIQDIVLIVFMIHERHSLFNAIYVSQLVVVILIIVEILRKSYSKG